MELRKLSNCPTVGQWVQLDGEEANAAHAALTEIQKANIANGGWAKIDYEVGRIRWPGQVIKAA